CQLPDMSHRIGKWALQHSFFGCIPKRGFGIKILSEIFEHPVEGVEIEFPICSLPGRKCAANKVRASVPQDVCHVTDELVRRTSLQSCGKLIKPFRRISKGLLRSIRQRSEKVAE